MVEVEQAKGFINFFSGVLSDTTGTISKFIQLVINPSSIMLIVVIFGIIFLIFKTWQSEVRAKKHNLKKGREI
jgi:hypothetical protein